MKRGRPRKGEKSLTPAQRKAAWKEKQTDRGSQIRLSEREVREIADGPTVDSLLDGLEFAQGRVRPAPGEMLKGTKS